MWLTVSGNRFNEKRRFTYDIKVKWYVWDKRPVPENKKGISKDKEVYKAVY